MYYTYYGTAARREQPPSLHSSAFFLQFLT
jgi:hypothetical protein